MLTIITRSRVEVDSPADRPRALDASAWAEIDQWGESDTHWDLRQQSRIVAWTDQLVA